MLKALAWKGVFLNVATYLCPFSSAWKGTFLNSNLFMFFFSPSFLFIFFRQIQGVTGALDLLLLRSRQQHPARVSPTSCQCHRPAQRPGTGMCASPARHRDGGRQGTAAGARPRNSFPTQPSTRSCSQVLACSISKWALLELNNSGSAAAAGPARQAAPPENANEAGAAEQQQQPPFGPRKLNNESFSPAQLMTPQPPGHVLLPEEPNCILKP